MCNFLRGNGQYWPLQSFCMGALKHKISLSTASESGTLIFVIVGVNSCRSAGCQCFLQGWALQCQILSCCKVYPTSSVMQAVDPT